MNANLFGTPAPEFIERFLRRICWNICSRTLSKPRPHLTFPKSVPPFYPNIQMNRAGVTIVRLVLPWERTRAYTGRIFVDAGLRGNGRGGASRGRRGGTARAAQFR